MAYKKGPALPPPGSTVGAGIPSCDLSSRFPALWAFVSDGVWDDGSQRETGTLLLCVGDGMVKVWLNDRAEGRSAWVSGETLADVLHAVDEALGAYTLTWRALPPPTRKR